MLDDVIISYIHSQLAKHTIESLKELHIFIKSLADNDYISQDDKRYYLHYISTTKAA